MHIVREIIQMRIKFQFWRREHKLDNAKQGRNLLRFEHLKIGISNDIALRRAELLARGHYVRKVLRDVLRARTKYMELLKKQREEAVALDLRHWRYIQFCTDIGAKLEWARNQISKDLQPALREIEKENGFPMRVRAPEYRGRESPLSFARRELGFIG
ncbi:hypothetical protein PMAYCL1PPCAC_31851 [Pristionchus mayeri]|uniref:Uncharacterized protein n=1 Tax=Pristionchus mayeri TaxID=1317129 RepID=A0AAN5DDS8_9BILA|nr:hypothetical protein PMAYCL1PPCAC_31851 [Pristionchus mayeri]